MRLRAVPSGHSGAEESDRQYDLVGMAVEIGLRAGHLVAAARLRPDLAELLHLRGTVVDELDGDAITRKPLVQVERWPSARCEVAGPASTSREAP